METGHDPLNLGPEIVYWHGMACYNSIYIRYGPWCTGGLHGGVGGMGWGVSKICVWYVYAFGELCVKCCIGECSVQFEDVSCVNGRVYIYGYGYAGRYIHTCCFIGVYPMHTCTLNLSTLLYAAR